MPTVLRIRGYRFFFYAAVSDEPPHVHVFKDGKELKVWLESMTTAVNKGFSSREVVTIADMAYENRDLLMEAWNDYF